MALSTDGIPKMVAMVAGAVRQSATTDEPVAPVWVGAWTASPMGNGPESGFQAGFRNVSVRNVVPPGRGDAETDRTRNEVNDWIRDRAPFDAVFDVDRVLADPRLPNRLHPDLDGDHTHPNDAGYAAMAAGVPALGFLRERI